MQPWALFFAVLSAALAAALIGIVKEGFRMWAGIQTLTQIVTDNERRLKEHQESDTKRFDAMDSHLDKINDRLNNQSQMLSTIVANTTFIRQIVDSKPLA